MKNKQGGDMRHAMRGQGTGWIFPWGVILLWGMLSWLLCGVSPARAGDADRILAGTSTVADILEDLAGERAEIRLLIPGGSCPGHYDLRPGDLRFLGEARLLVLEHFQPAMPNMQNLVRAADNEALRIVTLPEEPCALLPEAQKRLTLALADRLTEVWPEQAATIARAATGRLARIAEVESRMRKELQAAGLVPLPKGGVAPHAGAPTALCSALQEPLVRWAGLNVVGTYGRPEDLTPECFEQLLKLGREHDVRVVLDNIQSGPGAGRGLAESLGAGRADLTSFPEGVPGEDRWEEAFTGNIGRLLQALRAAKG